MHKTVSITIGEALFQIEEDAYDLLDEYLRGVRNHFRALSDHEEIVADIESRIAEEFASRIKGRKKTIAVADVRAMITLMGTVEDFERFEGEETAEIPDRVNVQRLRIYRDADDQVIAGVCAGLATAFGIDPLYVRLGFGLSIFLGGFGILLYIILWISLPEARTTAEKVEMTGNKVTLTAIQKRIDAAVPPEKRAGILRKIVNVPIAVVRAVVVTIGKILRVVFPALGRLLGLALVTAAIFLIAMATFALLALALNPHSPYIGIPLQDFVGRTGFLVLLLSAYFIAFLPLTLVLLGGASLAALRNLYSFPAVASIVTLWCAALVTAAVTGFTLAPSIEAAVERYEEQHLQVVTRTVETGSFRAIAVGGNTELTVTRGDTQSVQIEASAEEIEELQAIVEDGTLLLDRPEEVRHCFLFCMRRSPRLIVTVPTMEELTVSGGARGNIEGFGGPQLTLVTSGGARLTGTDLSAQSLTTTLSGGSRIQLTGTAATLLTTLGGGARLEAHDFSAATVTAELSGGAHATVHATERIEGSVSGGAHLSYRGQPATVEVERSGGAQVRALENE